MIKKVVVFGLGYQGKQFLRYFIHKNIKVIGVCKSIKTKENIEKDFNIKVFTDYKKVLDNSIDLLVLCAYPVDIYEKVISFSEQFSFKILADLPISFSVDFLKNTFPTSQIYLFHLETKLQLFKFIKKNISKINSIDCILYCNHHNSSNKNGILVDRQYILNNLLEVHIEKINIKDVYVNREIKNIEYLITFFIGDKKIIYKYEENLGNFIVIDNKNNNIILNKKFQFNYYYIISEYISDIEANKNTFQIEYLEKFTFLLLNYV